MAQHHQAIDIGRKQEAIAWIEAEGDGKPTRAIAHFRTKGWSLEGLLQTPLTGLLLRTMSMDRNSTLCGAATTRIWTRTRSICKP
ncbi:hypothetical protein PC116_g16186 [Phytophthora cactorum]|nr:hypothetical protein Pcac1_g18681 [Phytophthora cactorum]KAG4235706.1 hypothetical protein PC116_g16186 [Phytophthora cactorum]